jgi:hypothetical protein
MPNTKSQHIIDTSLYEALVEENTKLRNTLLEVSAVGASMMFHTHRNDCSSFTRDFLKSIVSITHEIDVQKVQDIYRDAYEVANRPGVLDR